MAASPGLRYPIGYRRVTSRFQEMREAARSIEWDFLFKLIDEHDVALGIAQQGIGEPSPIRGDR